VVPPKFSLFNLLHRF